MPTLPNIANLGAKTQAIATQTNECTDNDNRFLERLATLNK